MLRDDRAAGLQRAVLISLFTWRRAEADDALDDEERYGWWGDSFPTVTDDRIGSRLWLLRRRTLTADTERDARDYASEALQWLIDDEQVVSIDLTTERTVDRLNMLIVLWLPDGSQVTVFLDDTWQVINAV